MSSCMVFTPIYFNLFVPLIIGIPALLAGIPLANPWKFWQPALLFSHRLGPLIVPIRIALWRHLALDTTLGQLLFEFLPDIRILDRILDLVFSSVLDLLRVTVKLHRRLGRAVPAPVPARSQRPV